MQNRVKPILAQRHKDFLLFTSHQSHSVHFGDFGECLSRVISVFASALAIPFFSLFPLFPFVFARHSGHSVASFWTVSCILFSQTLEFQNFSNLSIGPATAGLELYFPILDILDTAVQNHPVIAGPCLAQRYGDTKNSLFSPQSAQRSQRKIRVFNAKAQRRKDKT